MTPIIQTIIALVAIIALFSIANSLILDGIRRILVSRAKELRRALENLLKTDDEGSLVDELYNHAFIQKLKKGAGRQSVSKIDPPLFAELFIQMMSKKGGVKDEDYADPARVLEKFESGIDSIEEGMKAPLRQLLAYAKEKQSDQLQELRNNIAVWYKDYMQVVSDRFRRKSRLILFGTGVVLCLIWNLDIIRITTELMRNDELRYVYYQQGLQMGREDIQIDSAKITQYIINHAENLQAEDLLRQISANMTAGRDSVRVFEVTSKSTLPIGWAVGDDRASNWPDNPYDLFLKLLGMLIMAGALAFGAPFWFDVLKKVTGVDRVIGS